MKHSVSLGTFLFVLWYLLSGHNSALLLGAGLVSSLLVVLLARRMGIIDAQTDPLLLIWRMGRFWPWLIGQIVLANLQVLRLALARRPAISPTLVRLQALPRTDAGRATLANAITLTPGTVTLQVDGDRMLVHALTRDGARELVGGDMNSRVRALERD